MQRRYLRQEKGAIRDSYRQNVIYRAVRDACTQFERLTAQLRFSHEEVFVESCALLDQMKEDPHDASRYISTLWDGLYNDIRSLDDKAPDDEIKTGVTVILYITCLLITESAIEFYRDRSVELLDQIACNNPDAQSVMNLINPAFFKLSEKDFAELRYTVDQYLNSDQWISDDVEKMLNELSMPNLQKTEPNEVNYVHLANGKKTAVVILLKRMYEKGWLVDAEGNKLSNRDKAIREIMKNAFGEENVSSAQILSQIKNRNKTLEEIDYINELFE